MGEVEEGKLYVYTPREDCSLTSLPGTGSGPPLLALFTRGRGLISNLLTKEWPPLLTLFTRGRALLSNPYQGPPLLTLIYPWKRIAL
jgi:hypothetical protein